MVILQKNVLPLFNIKQCISALGEISEQLAVISGVIQGNCLGPLIFLIITPPLVYKIPYRRARACSAFRPSARASKVILHTTPPPGNTYIYKSSVIWNSVKIIFKIVFSGNGFLTVQLVLFIIYSIQIYNKHQI